MNKIIRTTTTLKLNYMFLSTNKILHVNETG